MTEAELKKHLDAAEKSPKEIAAAVSGLPGKILRYKPSPPLGADGKPTPQPPDTPLGKGRAHIWVITSDKPGDEKDDARTISVGITDGLYTEVTERSLAVGAKVVTDETDSEDLKKKKKGF